MMFSALRHSQSVLFCIALCSIFTIGEVYGHFTTVIDIPQDSNIDDDESIGSHTQLNLSAGGEIGSSFDAGDPNSTHVEVNIFGGSVGVEFDANSGSVVNIFGGSVGEGFSARSGSVVNIFGGSVDDGFEANSGSVVNISGGSVEDGFEAFDGSIVNISSGSVGVDFEVFSGSVVNISGGLVRDEFVSQIGSVVNISGGSVGNDFDASGIVNISGGSVGNDFEVSSGSVVDISGGSVGNSFDTNSGSMVGISGGEFRLNGALIGGLDTVGNTLPFNLPVDSVLSGTLADGTPFAFSSFDSIAFGTLTLEAAELPTVGPALIVLPSDPVPLGIRTGQTLVVDDGGTIDRRNFNAGWGSTVLVTGGRLNSNFEAVGAEVTIASGSVRGIFDAFSGSVVDISGGSVGDLFRANSGSEVNISGGSVDADFDAFTGSVVNLFGTEFVLDGVDITALLTVNDPNTITDRDVTLSGLLTDGSPFSFDLNSTNVSGQDYFDLGATLSVTLFLPGDFDGNRVVDGSDFLAWQRGESPDPLSASDLTAWEANYGTVISPPEPGDFDGNGVVDGSDFLAWQRGESPDPLSSADLADWEANYGMGVGSLASTTAAASMIPEPSTFVLLLLALCSTQGSRQRFAVCNQRKSSGNSHNG